MVEIEPGDTIAGKYRLDRPLSQGGMGSVWIAEHLHLDAPVAVKFMHRSLVEDQSARARFEREAKAAAQIRSPHVVHVYDHGIDRGVPFIVMEYLEGIDLRDRLRGRRRLRRAEAARICDQICRGLSRAHRAGIVHRDLKPANIFLSAEDGLVKILDFGIAKETGNKRVVRGDTVTGEILGSPHYMSPEQARGRRLDGRSDLWSLAVILFRALTGRRPFDGHDVGDLIVRICSDPIPAPSDFAPELGPEVDAFFRRALARNARDRPQSAEAFAAELREALGVSEASLEGSWDPCADAADARPSGDSSSSVGGGDSSSGLGRRWGRMHVPPGTAEPGADTLAATTTSPRDHRLRLIGGGIAAVAVGAAVALTLMGSPKDVSPPSSAPSPLAAPTNPEPPRSHATAPSSRPSAQAAPAPSTSTSTTADEAAPEPPPPAPRPPPRPRLPRPKPPPPEPTPAPQPEPAPQPAPGSSNPFGY